MTATTSRPPLSDRLTSSKVIAVLRAPHVSALAPYLVTPTMNLPVVKLAVERQTAVFPGGARYLKHLRGPFPDLEAIPSGGVDLKVIRESPPS